MTKAKKVKAKSKAKKKTNLDKLNLRERKLFAGLEKGLNPTQAAIQAGYAESTARGRLKDILGKPRMQEAIADLMERMGISDEKLMRTLDEGLGATKTISAMVVAPNGEGMKDANSMTKDFVDVPDFVARHKFLETGLKLKGHMKEKVEVEHTHMTYEERLKMIHERKGL